MERFREAPGTFHARELPAPLARTAWVCEPTEPALVLGSSQPAESVDAAACAAAGVSVVRRRSGGGAVLVEPDGQLWVDVLLPVGDPLWLDDVGRAFLWVGEAWAAALRSLGGEAEVHRGGLERSAWSDRVCFAGLGTGEVVRPATRAKVVGISQRRTRVGARFQCAAPARWDAGAVVALLALDPADRSAARRDLETAADGVGVPLGALLDAFLAALP